MKLQEVIFIIHLQMKEKKAKLYKKQLKVELEPGVKL